MTTSPRSETVPGWLRVRELMTTGLLAQAVTVLCDLGVPEALITPRDVVALAKEVDADPEGLVPFLRAGCAAGVLDEPEPKVFVLTELGQVLRADHPESVRLLCSLTGREEFHRTWANALHSARTAEPGFPIAYGKPFFDYMKATPEFAALFDRAMASSAAVDNLLSGYSFDGARHVVDVGGGRGAMLTAILTRYPHLRGTLVELPHVAEAAREVFAKAGVTDRVTVVPGSFFDPIPEDGDRYLLSRVVGNWNDADSVRILRGVRAAMDADDRLVIVGNVPSGNDRTNYPRQLDLYMFVLLGARLRDYDEYEVLLREAGFTPTGMTNFPDSESVIEAMPA
ncbi:methyltransferase [Saccharothrix saharensis]|uniref:methyltransferase n=1 Tax=Saccharothrix saharensis TaxID=571190 RepID=UPI0036AE9219